MILLIVIFTLVWIGAGIYSVIGLDNDWLEAVGHGLFVGFISALFFGVIISMIISASYDAPSYTYTTDESIVAVSDGDSTQVTGSGFIFLSIDSDNYSYYNYMTQGGDGVYKRGQVDANWTTVEENGEVDPHVHHFCRVEPVDSRWYLELDGPVTTCWHRIFVPEGTVTQDFNIDLEG